jgi:hypothetical protein
MILKKVHKNFQGDILIALCDDSAIDNVYEEDGLVIDTKNPFFGNEEISDKELNSYFSRANSVYAVGQESVGLLISKNIISKEQAKKINGMVYVNIVLKL